ncbi:DUF945 family protein [Thalassotalea euphylliae]|uniref:DUF945 family protein n=1 Tax=Thalassotalea euphylliae TaxID=1655234 RepID=UPI0036317F8B
MKKVIALSASAIAVASAFILPNFVGSAYQSQHQETIALLGQNPAISVKDYEFKREWFSATTKITFEIDTQIPEQEPFQFIVNEDITFGPIHISSEGTHFSLAKSIASFDIPVIADEETVNVLNEHISLSSSLSWLGNHSSNIATQAYQTEIAGKQLDIQPSHGHFVLNGDELEGDFTWQGMSLMGDSGHVKMAPVNMTFDQTLIAGDLYSGTALATGDFMMRFDEFSLLDNESGAQVDVAGVQISGHTSEDDNLLGVTLKYHADSIGSMGQQVTDANFDIAIRNLDIDTVMALNELNRTLPSDPNDPAFGQAMMQALPTAMKLLDYNPEIILENISVMTDAGLVATDAKFSIDKQLFDPRNPMSIAAAAKVNAKGSAPESFFAQFGLAPMIDGYVNQGFIQRNDGELSFNLEMTNGQLNVNGKPLPL